MLPATVPACVTPIGGSLFQASLAIGTFPVMALDSRIGYGARPQARSDATHAASGPKHLVPGRQLPSTSHSLDREAVPASLPTRLQLFRVSVGWNCMWCDG